MNKPCPPGKTRNPETKRCRKVKSTSPKPCPPGKTRNPVTKRCRKVKSASPKILNKTRTPSLTRKRTPTKSQVKVKEFDTGLYIDGDDFLDFYNQLEGTVISSHSILPNIPSNHNLYTYQISPTGATAYAPLRILDKNSSYGNSLTAASVYNNGTVFLVQDTGNPVTVAGRKYVIAVSIKKDDYDAVFDGGDLLSDSSGDLYTADHISFGYYKPSPQAYLNGHIQRLIYYPTKLTNNQLKTITS